MSQIRQLCKNICDDSNPNINPDYHPYAEYVKIDPYAVTTLDSFQEELENSAPVLETSAIMADRIGIMAFKLAMLIALSRGDPSKKRRLEIEHEDAIAAVAVAQKWRKWADAFAGSLYDSSVEKHVRRVQMYFAELGPEIPRHAIAKRMRMTKRDLDEVQMTMVDRGMIRLEERRLPGSHKPSLMWIQKDDEEEEKSTLEAGRDNPEG